MEILKMVEGNKNLQWKFDAEADVLYISFDEPRKAEGIDLGDGIIMRIDNENNEIVGITIINPLKRTLEKLQEKS